MISFKSYHLVQRDSQQNLTLKKRRKIDLSTTIKLIEAHLRKALEKYGVWEQKKKSQIFFDSYLKKKR